jgi:hypothetical protein
MPFLARFKKRNKMALIEQDIDQEATLSLLSKKGAL